MPTTSEQVLELGRSTYRAFSAIQRWMDRAQHRRGRGEVSPTEVWLLGRIATAGPVRMSALATWQEVDRSTMTAQVAHLEGRHLVERTPDPADRRAVAVSITEAGRETLARHEDEIAEVLADLFQDWAEDDLGDLAVRLGRLADTIEARSGSGEG